MTLYLLSNMGVSKNRDTAKWMVKIMENPIKIHDLEVPLFLVQHPYGQINVAIKNAHRIKPSEQQNEFIPNRTDLSSSSNSCIELPHQFGISQIDRLWLRMEGRLSRESWRLVWEDSTSTYHISFFSKIRR